MTAATSQPSPPITLTAAYSGKVDGGWVAYDYVGNQIGAATLTPTAQFTAIKSSGTLADGSTTLSANAATDAGAIASMSISTAVVKNAFTLVGVFEVRGTSGAGVGARSNTDNIFLWRNAGNYSVRLNNVTTSGGAMPLNTKLNYVFTSNTSGSYLYVNGTLILSAAASASSATTGVPLELYEDSRGGGGMDLDVAMVALLNYGASTTEAQSLSNNPWQMFDVASSGTTVSPSNAALTLSTDTPTISQPQTVAPSAFALGIAGYAATISQPQTVAPTGASLGLTGYVPTVSQQLVISPLPASLSLGTYSPTISQPKTLAPGGASITLSGYAPTISQVKYITPTVAVVTIMRAASMTATAGKLSASTSIAAGTMASKLALATIMRAQATSRVAAIHSDPINLTASLL